MFCVAFGLSMDYEVFLLARIREYWLESPRTRQDSDESVALGLARTGRVVTAAALIMAIAFAALIAAQVSFMRIFGLGLTLAVLADATLVRMALLPALRTSWAVGTGGLPGRWSGCMSGSVLARVRRIVRPPRPNRWLQWEVTANTIDHPFFAWMWTVMSAHESRLMRRLRTENLAGLTGRVLEVGAGTGTNFAHYPDTVSEVVAVSRKLAGAKASARPPGRRRFRSPSLSPPSKAFPAASCLTPWCARWCSARSPTRRPFFAN